MPKPTRPPDRCPHCTADLTADHAVTVIRTSRTMAQVATDWSAMLSAYTVEHAKPQFSCTACNIALDPSMLPSTTL